MTCWRRCHPTTGPTPPSPTSRRARSRWRRRGSSPSGSPTSASSATSCTSPQTRVRRSGRRSSTPVRRTDSGRWDCSRCPRCAWRRATATTASTSRTPTTRWWPGSRSRSPGTSRAASWAARRWSHAAVTGRRGWSTCCSTTPSRCCTVASRCCETAMGRLRPSRRLRAHPGSLGRAGGRRARGGRHPRLVGPGRVRGRCRRHAPRRHRLPAPVLRPRPPPDPRRPLTLTRPVLTQSSADPARVDTVKRRPGRC